MTNLDKHTPSFLNLFLGQEQIWGLLDNLPVCITYMDVQQKYRFVNKAYEEWVGLSLEQINGKHLREVIGEDAYNIALPNIEKVLRGERGQYEAEYSCRDKNRYVHVRLVPDLDQQNHIRGYYTYIQDITTQKQAEEALKESEKRYLNLVESVQVGLYRNDAEGNCIYINKKCGEILDISFEESLNLGWVNRLHPEDKQRVMESWQAAYISKSPWKEEYRFCHRDGKVIWVIVEAVFEFDSHGDSIGSVGSLTDITETKEATEKLRQNELNLRQITNNIPGAVFQYRQTQEGNHQFIFISDGIKQLYEIPPEDIIKDAELMWSVLLPEDREEFNQSVEQAINNLEIWFREFRLKTPSGKMKWIAGASTPEFKEDGQIIWSGILTDITERKQIEENLQQALKSASDIKNALNHSSMVLITNSQGSIIFVNDRFCQISGYSREELINKNPRILNSGYHPKVFFHDLWSTISEGKVWQGEIKNKTKQGDFYWIDTTIIPCLDDQGKPFKYLSIRTDITNRKKQEEALLQSEGKNRALLQAIPDLILCANNDGVYIDYKLSNEFSTAVPPHQFLGKKPHDIFPSPLANQIMEAYQTALITHQVQFLEYDLEIEEKINNYEARIMATETQEIMAIIRNITVRKEQEFMLKKSKEEAEEANRAKSVFLANMSHELRSPLNAILGFSQLLERDDNLNPEQHKKIKIINQSGEYLLNLINDILDLTKIENGSSVVNESEFNLKENLENIQDLFTLKAHNKNLNFEYSIDSNLPTYILGDRLKIRQVLTNLISNAIKYTHKGLVSCQFKYQLNDLNQEAMIAIIADTGVGIPEAEIPYIFDPFIQTKSGKNSQVGTGLGLAITYNHVRLLGGKIAVKSGINKGSVFRVKLPIVRFEKQEYSWETSSQKIIEIADNQPSYRILIVDDNLANRYLIKEFLSITNFEIAEAKNGKEAVKKYEPFQPDLIFMDIKMPIMDGIEATKIIKQKMKEKGKIYPKIVALTASAFEQEKFDILSFCDNILIKPITENQLFSEIANQLKVSYRFREKDSSSSEQLTENIRENNLYYLPADWIENIQNAILTLDYRQIKQLIAQIKLEHKSLYELLSEALNNYNYEIMINILKESVYPIIK